MNAIDVFDSKVSYNFIDDKGAMSLVEMVRQGVKFSTFINFADKSPFSLTEWSSFLHLSERTMQRYKREEKTFDPLQSEKILEIAILYRKGTEVFGDEKKFNTWLNTDNVALGTVKPTDLLDNSFGINLLSDELGRIQHGILA